MTSIFTRIASAFRDDWRTLTEDARQWDTRGLGGTIPQFQAGRPQWPTDRIDTYVSDGYRKTPVVYRCISALSNAVSSAPLKVYQEKTGGQRTEVPNHPLRQLFRSPNPSMGESPFWAFTTMLMASSGFCVLEIVRSKAGRPVELWHLRPDWLKPIPRDQLPPNWEYKVPGNPAVTLPADEVIVLTYTDDLTFGYTGLSPISVALRAIGVENAAVDFLKLFLEHGGVPQHALVYPNAITDQAKADAIKAKWQQAYGGFGRWADVALLSGGLDFKQIGMNLDDMVYPQLRDMTAIDICLAFGIPPVIVGVKVGLENSPWSNIGDARMIFHQDAVMPLWGRIDDVMTRRLLPEFDSNPNRSLAFDTSDIPALQEDVTPTWQRATAALTAGGILLDEYRSELSLPPLPNGAGKVLYLPFSVTVTMPDELIAPDPPPQPVPPALVPAVVPVADGTDPKALPSGDAVGDGTDAAKKAARSLPGGHTERLLTWSRGASNRVVDFGEWWNDGFLLDDGRRAYPITDRRAATFTATNRKAMATLAKKGAPKLRAFWKQQAERIIGGLPRSLDDRNRCLDFSGVLHEQGWAESYRHLLLQNRDIAEVNWDDEERLLAEVLGQYHNLIGEMAFGVTAQQIGVDLDWDLANPNVRRVLNDLATRIKGINETTREDVRRMVNETMDAGGAMDDLARNLRGLFEEMYKGRSMTVARTESQNAYSKASILGYQESNVVAYTELADNVEHTEDYGAADGLSCSDRNGLVIPLEEADLHIESEHPNGTLSCLPVLIRPLGEED